MLRSRVLAVPLVLLVAVALTGCGVVDRVRDVVHQATSGDDSGGYTDDGSDDGPPPNTDIADLKAGDCFLQPYDDLPTAVDKVGCSTDHDDEVTALVPVAGTEYPGDLRVDKQGQIACRDALTAYVGREFATSSLDYWYFTPDASTWNGGDHTIVCFGYSWEGDTLDSSIRGTKL